MNMWYWGVFALLDAQAAYWRAVQRALRPAPQLAVRLSEAELAAYLAEHAR